MIVPLSVPGHTPPRQYLESKNGKSTFKNHKITNIYPRRSVSVQVQVEISKSRNMTLVGCFPPHSPHMVRASLSRDDWPGVGCCLRLQTLFRANQCLEPMSLKLKSWAFQGHPHPPTHQSLHDETWGILQGAHLFYVVYLWHWLWQLITLMIRFLLLFRPWDMHIACCTCVQMYRNRYLVRFLYLGMGNPLSAALRV